MLDNETKRRIDACRDVLVGKIPDPKSQVEQITIALIYKFMDDMDKESVDMGGKSSFFTGEYKKYSWTAIFDPRIGGHELVKLYDEALERMNQNPNIPQLFRDIFNNAYLPYRDPETLKLFLKEINNFEYSHSEKLGDAFEYLLSFMGTQGDAGQFRTPRHIIDFIVQVVDPQKTETILDPGCGTAGFLISAYKHILKANDNGKKLTPTERKRLLTSFSGYDISPDMVRLSLVNLYLHGFQDPKIYEYDTLTSEERWDETVDVVLANPPFMTPKGGIRPHKRFSVQANRSEVLFVDYIAEHLNPGGRAGVIVPEGIIFQSSNAYKALRKMLIEDYLWAVVSLPAGVFNPYSGVKTSILLMDKTKAKQSDSILFVKVENDGFDLGAQRRPIDKNDLPEALQISQSGDADNTEIAHWVEKSKIEESGDWNLSGERYRDDVGITHKKWDMVELGDDDYFIIESGGTPSSKVDEYWNGNINWATLVDLPQDNFITEISSTARKITELGLKKSSAKILPPKSILVSSRATIGRIAIAISDISTNQGFKNIVIKDFQKVNERYTAFALTNLIDKMLQMASGGTFKEISKTNFSKLQIPLPPLSVQEEIVAEIDGYQKIIDGARQVVDNYKPTIKIDPDWEMVKLGEVCDLLGGGTPSRSNDSFWENGTIKWLSARHIDSEGKIPYYELITEEAIKGSSSNVAPIHSTIAVSRVSVGKVAYADDDYAINQDLTAFIRKDEEMLDNKFLFHMIKQNANHIEKNAQGLGVRGVTRDFLKKMQIPLPPLSTQQKIVAQIEAERKMVDGNKKLIEIYEQKVKDKIGEVWGE